jgi:outer membrane receptor protein involved in Fe transport
LISAAVAAAIAGSALPQHAMAAEDDKAAAEETQVSEVVVTGSRIVRRDLSAPSPIMTVGKDQFANSAQTGAEAVLNRMPQFSPTATQFTSSIQGGATSNPGAVTLNLRGLGVNRNLVLIDGRRGQPSDATLAIDINTIPAAAIENVEVITGGASAVYGPDAIAGVTNFILKNNFQGLDVDVQRGQTFHNDGAETRVNALFGMNGADGKGNVMFGLDWTKRDAALQKNRSFYVNGWLDPADPSGGFLNPPAYQATGNQPSQAAINTVLPGAPAGLAKPGTQFNFNNDGSIFLQQGGGYGYNGPFNNLNAGRDTAIKVLSTNNQLDQAFTGGYASIPLERHAFFGRGTYDFNDYVSAFAQASYSKVEVLTRGGYPPAITTWQVSIPRDGRPLPAALNTLLDSRANPSAPWTLSQVLDYNGPINVDNVNNVWQALVGLRGKLPFRDWTYEAYASKGGTQIDANYSGLPSYQRYAFLVAQPNWGMGTNLKATPSTPPQPVGTSETLSGYSMSCTTGLPVFQQFTPSQDCLTSIADPMVNRTNLGQDIIEANIQGLLAPLPAGEARFAFGATYRRDDFSYQPGNPSTLILDSPIGLFASAATVGSTNVKEVYSEFLVPIIRKLDLELGYRFSDFNTAGGKGTYKALFTWKALGSLTFRGGYQLATRAPNTAELFTGPTQQVVSFPNVDPCSAATLSPWGNVQGNPNRKQVQALCRAIIGNNTSGFDTQTYNTPNGPDGFTRQSPAFFPLEIEIDTGNPKVGPEIGRTWTFGAVISEPFDISRLTATIDAYRIAISNTISPQSSTTVYNNCFNFDGKSNPNYSVDNPYCQLIRRDPVTGDRASVVALYSNLGTLLTQGIDFQLNWARDLGPGLATFGLNGNWLNKFVYQTAPTSKLVDAKGTVDSPGGVFPGGQFTYRTLTNVGYNIGGLSLDWSWEHLPSVKNQAVSIAPTSKLQGAPHYDLFNFTSSYSWEKYSVRFGIDNVLDKQPLSLGANPGVTDASNMTNPGFYDVLGRRYYVGVRAQY